MAPVSSDLSFVQVLYTIYLTVVKEAAAAAALETVPFLDTVVFPHRQYKVRNQ